MICTHLVECAVGGIEQDCVGEIVVFAAEREPLGVHVHHRDIAAGESGEFQHGQTDGPGADDEQMLAGLGIRSVDSVAADGEGFDEGELFERELRGRVKLVGADDESLAEAAIGMDAEDLQVLAAIAASAAARETFAIVHVRFDRAAIATANILVRLSRFRALRRRVRGRGCADS